MNWNLGGTYVIVMMAKKQDRNKQDRSTKKKA